MLKELESKITDINTQIEMLSSSSTAADKMIKRQLIKTRHELLSYAWRNLTPADRVYLARHPKRPNAKQYIDALFTDFFLLHGDRFSKEDKSIIGGIAFYKDIPITVLAQQKGKTLEENIACNFGMPGPEGYRKVQRLAKQAEKFHRPIITFIDTPGAYPGLEAEEKGQGEAIASCLALFSKLTVPVIAVVIGEGGSGGALAISVGNSIIMLENSIYSILSPEGFATILWKDGSRSEDASKIMKLTAQDLYDYNVIDYIIPEGVGGAHTNPSSVFQQLDEILYSELMRLSAMDPNTLVNNRYHKFRSIGNLSERPDKEIT